MRTDVRFAELLPGIWPDDDSIPQYLGDLSRLTNGQFEALGIPDDLLTVTVTVNPKDYARELRRQERAIHNYAEELTPMQGPFQVRQAMMHGWLRPRPQHWMVYALGTDYCKLALPSGTDEVIQRFSYDYIPDVDTFRADVSHIPQDKLAGFLIARRTEASILEHKSLRCAIKALKAEAPILDVVFYSTTGGAVRFWSLDSGGGEERLGPEGADWYPLPFDDPSWVGECGFTPELGVMVPDQEPVAEVAA